MCDLGTNYGEVILLIERLHRRFLSLVKRELERLGFYDVTSVQCIMLCNLGDAELTVGELTSRGYHVSSNVSYNVKKLVENGYLLQERSTYDRRSIHVRLTDRGYVLYDRLYEMYRRHSGSLHRFGILDTDLQEATAILGRLEVVWSSASDIGASQELR